MDWTEYPNNYTGRKRATYERALGRLLAGSDDKRAARLKSFVKFEKTDFTTKTPVPRIIQARSPEFHIRLGCYLRPLEHGFYAAINRLAGRWQGPVVMKGMNSRERARWIEFKWNLFKDPVFVGLDASRFDAHVHRHFLVMCHKLYKYAYRRLDPVQRADLASLLNFQLRNRGVVKGRDGSISYCQEGGRASGDVDTSLGNVLIMCMVIIAYLSGKAPRIAFIDDGDDSGMFLERKHLGTLADLVSWFGALGLDMEVEEPVDVLEKVVFCQCQPVFNGTEYVMCRQFPAVIDKDTHLARLEFVSSDEKFRGYLRAVGLCGLATMKGIPVVTALYSRMLQVAGQVEAVKLDEWSGLVRQSAGMTEDYAAIDGYNEAYVASRNIPDLARLSFWSAFGLPPTAQTLLEDAIMLETFLRPEDRTVTPRRVPYSSVVAKR
jgi:hypothetical protein